MHGADFDVRSCIVASCDPFSYRGDLFSKQVVRDIQELLLVEFLVDDPLLPSWRHLWKWGCEPYRAQLVQLAVREAYAAADVVFI